MMVNNFDRDLWGEVPDDLWLEPTVTEPGPKPTKPTSSSGVAKLDSEQAVAKLEQDDEFFLNQSEDWTRQDLILMVELCFTLYEEDGEMPSYQQLCDSIYRATPTPKNYKKIFKSNEFAVATSYRGIPKGQGLTSKQMLTLRAITNQVSRYTLDTKLKRLGVSQEEYKAWLRYPPFKRKLNELSNNALKEAEASGDVALAQQVTQGRLDAIKYADLRSGRYDPGRQQAIDVEYVMRQMLEIIQKHVTDSATLRAIGGELSLLAGAAGLDPTQTGGSPVAINPNPQEVPDLWQ